MRPEDRKVMMTQYLLAAFMIGVVVGMAVILSMRS